MIHEWYQHVCEIVSAIVRKVFLCCLCNGNLLLDITANIVKALSVRGAEQLKH